MSYFTAFDRHAYIFSKILRKEVINTVKISKYLGVTRKTIERDLKNSISPLFESELIPIGNDWKVQEPIIDIKFYEPSELSAIAFIFKNIGNDNPKLYSKTINLFNELHKKVSHSIYKQSSVEDILAMKKNEFYIIKNAIEDKKEIKFKFHSYDKHVQPLKIANLEKYWYLLCFDLNASRFSKYPLRGINTIDVLDNTFDFNEDNYINSLDNAINAFFDINNQIEVILELDWEANKVLSSVLLNSTQTINKNDDDMFIMSITISNLMEIIPLIQQWIPHIKVISPISLKEKIKENLTNYKI